MINILFCGNDKVFVGMITTMLSIFKELPQRNPLISTSIQWMYQILSHNI